MDPHQLTPAVLEGAKALVVCHIHGTPADVPALKEAAGDLPIIEDCSQATGSKLDGRFVGTFGDLAIHSFGPNKCLYAGEGGMILTRDWALYEKVLRETCHPIRQTIAGAGDTVDCANLSIRPHPMTALMLLSELRTFDAEARGRAFDRLAAALSAWEGARIIGADRRRQNASGKVPVYLERGAKACRRSPNCTPSGAFALETMAKTDLPIYLVSAAAPER
jgi:dTDP-4-amino-4,6-dideoxygalactose transaminase